MIVNRSALQSIYSGFKTIFNKFFQSTKTNFEKVCTIVTSNTGEEKYPWLGNIPGMREWIGEREINNLAVHDYTIKNKDWESTVSVDRNDIEDDKIGIYKPMVEMMGYNAKKHPDKLVFQLLMDGFNTVCYDGQYFFDEDHPVGDKFVSNKGTAALSPDSFGQARAQMMSLTNEDGDALDIVPDLLVVGPDDERMAEEICYSKQINGSDNTYEGKAKVLVIPGLAKMPGAWFLLATGMPIKPLIFQERKKPKFVALTSETDENVFMQKKYVYGVDSRCNVGFSLWQLAYGSTGQGV